MNLEEYWNIGITKKSLSDFIFNDDDACINWIAIEEDGSFRADPFGYTFSNENYIFYEYYNYRHANPKGEIRVLKVNNAFEVQSDSVVFAPQYHTSYPSIIKTSNEIFLCPETYQSGTISLYEFEEFPHKIRQAAVLSDFIQGIDPSIFYHEDRWWMFFGDFRLSANKNVYLAHSKDLFGPWTIHKKCDFFKPLISAFSGSRMAGGVLTHNNKLYRLGQYCVDGYGRAICLYEITKINPLEYEERFIRYIKPQGTSFQKYNAGLHHLSSLGGWTVLDAKYHTTR